MDTDGTRAIIPPNVPLMAKTPRAAEIFDIPRGQLLKLRKRYPDFPAVKIGRDTYYDIPRCYAWFGQYLGSEIETE